MLTKYMILVLIIFQVSFASEQEIFEVKCEKGDMYYCHKLGRELKKIKEYEKAIYYFNLVCDNNISDGCMSLATYYDLKNRKYKKNAFEYYTKACALNNRFACNNLGNFYRYGKVVDKNISRAISFFEKAYCLGDIDKPYRNRQKAIEENKLTNYNRNNIDCVFLKIDESIDTANKIDDESAYQ